MTRIFGNVLIGIRGVSGCVISILGSEHGLVQSGGDVTAYELAHLKVNSGFVELPTQPNAMIRSTAMNFRAKWWKGAQSGQYEPVEVEEGTHESDISSGQLVATSKASSLLASLETLVRIICVLMFLAGAGMMWSSRAKTTNNITYYGANLSKKEVECTEQLSVWCKLAYP